MTRLLKGIIVAILFFSLAVYCSRPSPEERFAEIKKLYQENKIPEALEATVLLAEDLSRSNSLQLDTGSDDRMLSRSLDGSTAAWVQSGRLHVRKNMVTRSFPLTVSPEGLNLSFDGNILSVWRFRSEGDCRYEVIRINDDQSESAMFRFPDCSTQPLFTSTGFIYHIRGQSLHRSALRFMPGLQEIKESVKIADAAAVRPPVPRIGHTYRLYDGGSGLVLLFAGSLGVYRLYIYQESAKRLNTAGSSFASSQIIYSSVNSINKKHPDPENKKRNPVFPNQPVNPALKNHTDFYLFEGTAGRYSLRLMRIEKNNIRMMHAFRTAPLRTILHTGPGNLFLTLREDRISEWNPYDNTVKELPLRAGSFTLFDEGLLYEGIDQNLYLRNTEFTDLEKEIMDFEEMLRAELRKQAEEKSEADDGK